MMKTEKPRSSTTLFVRDLNTGDRFVLPGEQTVYVVDSRYNGETGTRVSYRVEGRSEVNVFTKRQMSVVYRLALKDS